MIHLRRIDTARLGRTSAQTQSSYRLRQPRSTLFYGVLTIALVQLLGACTLSQPQPTDATKTTEVTVMTFNVENLFDAMDDPGKDDHAYLPLTEKRNAAHIALCEPIEVPRWRDECLALNWTEDAVDFKLRQLAASILQVNDGKGPDIVAMQEVENIGILQRLSRDYLQAAGYETTVLIEGRDNRGIDVGFLSRLPLNGDAVLHPFDLVGFPERAGDTRGILQATFVLPDGQLLSGFVAHFPAPYHPIEMREQAYDHLNALRAQVPDDHWVFAAGDFNTPAREMRDTSIMDDRVRPYWTVAHEVDCDGCVGTNYWSRGKSWSFLDMVLFSPAKTASASTWTIPEGGVFVADDYDDQLNGDGTVRRFDLDQRRGVSDHLPLAMTLQRTSGE